MNIIQDFSARFPMAWDAFMDWARQDNTMLLWDALKGSELDKREARCLLADLQAWINQSKYVRVWASWHNDLLWWIPNVHVPGAAGDHYWVYTNFTFKDFENFTEEQALHAAINKGLEIFENQTT